MKPRVAQPAKDSDRPPAAMPPRLPWGVAVLAIAVLSALLWLGIVRLVGALV